MASIETRVYNWNKVRDHVEFSSGFELRLMSEEVAEGIQAVADNNITVLIDSICDMDFVFGGTTYKYGLRKYDAMASMSSLENNESNFESLRKFYVRNRQALFASLSMMLNDGVGNQVNEVKIHFILDKSLELVCDANDQKPIEKDADGKNQKGEDFISPDKKIESLWKSVVNGTTDH